MSETKGRKASAQLVDVTKAEGIPTLPRFEMPKFEVPKFEVPAMEVPPVVREIAEKSVAQARDAYEKIKANTEEATDALEETLQTAQKGAADLGLKAIESARANLNASFDYARDMMAVKSMSDAVEISTGFMRRQFEAYAAQSKDFWALAQKVATDASEPVKGHVAKAIKKVA